MTKKNLPGKLERWSLDLLEFPGIKVVHRPGQQIPGVDYLSRNVIDEEVSDIEDYFTDRIICAITDTNQVPSCDDYRLHQSNDPIIADIIRRLKEGTLMTLTFFLRNDILFRYHNGRLVLELPETTYR